jgi:hypothetical protein
VSPLLPSALDIVWLSLVKRLLAAADLEWAQQLVAADIE